MRRRVVAANWKMNLNAAAASDFLNGLKREFPSSSPVVEVVVCPPYTCLHLASKIVDGSSIAVGAQDVSSESPGAFTGEIACEMLRDAGCSWVIVGHSERRQYHAESDSLINRKLRRSLQHGLQVIVCVGELLTEREAGQTEAVLERQMAGAFDGVMAEEMARVVVAYEPVWAIGTGRVATQEQAQAAHLFLRGWLRQRFNADVAGATRILYGGSVKADNAAGLLSQPDIDGALVGGASLKLDTFLPIVQAGMLPCS